MGGGVGISAHASVRVVTDTSRSRCRRWASDSSPTSAVPTYSVPAPGSLGLHAALTGAPFSGAGRIALGFADHFVQRAHLANSPPRSRDGVEQAVEAFAEPPPPSILAAQRDWIDECYARETVDDIVAALLAKVGRDAHGPRT